MRRDELITRLAMELAEWPNTFVMIPPINAMPAGSSWDRDPIGRWNARAAEGDLTICRGDYLAERERLINKPNWDDAPEWANYLCQQQTGEWWWYANEPKTGDSGWAEWAVWGRGLRLAGRGGRIPAGHNWKDTLEKRPEPMPRAWDGEGLPPVGTVCEAKLDSDAWVEAEILAHYRPNGPSAGGPEVAVFAYRRTPTSDNRHVDQLISEFFRPLRSEEDRAVDAMTLIMMNNCGTYGEAARALYSAGYRKTGGDE